MRVALVGMTDLPEPDIDERPALDALRAAGIDAAVLHWDSTHPDHDPAAFDACILRATWDYYRRPDEFLRWVRAAAERTTLCNPPDTVEWNLHKRYLLELESAGIPIVPTQLVHQGGAADLRAITTERDWPEVVIKPAISAASWKTRRCAPDEEGQAFLIAELADRDMLIQEFVPEVAHGAETAVVCIQSRPTHAVGKQPRFAGHDESVVAREVDTRHAEFARAVLDAAGRDALYARVDIIQRADGSLQLSELELIEPSLYFPFSDAGLRAFVEAVGRLSR